MKRKNLVACALAALVAGTEHRVDALGTAFTYQGQLQQGGNAATGPCDFELSLWDALGAGAPPAGGNQIGSTQTASAVSVTDGVFTLQLDFGAVAFNSGNDRWLQIAVRCPTATGSYQALAPRQPLTPAPFALFASSIADGSVSSTKLAPGAVTTTQLATNAVTSAQIADGTITMNDLANGAVSTAKIGDGQVTAAKLVAPLSLTSTVAHSFTGAFDGISTGLNSVGVSGTANNGSNAYGLYGLANAGSGVVGSSSSGTGVVGQGAGDAGVSGTSNEDGVVGESTGQGGTGVRGKAGTGPAAAGVRGRSIDGAGVVGDSDNGPGISGTSDNGPGVSGSSGGDDGVVGVSGKSNGTGVHGTADKGAQARGVFGESDQGAGVSGQSNGSYGVVGQGPEGVLGVAGVPAGVGVAGVTSLAEPDVADANGVRGDADNGVGVRGDSTANTGVYGKSKAVSTFTIAGVVGEAAGNNGIGVRGVADVGTNAWGVLGESAHGIGVRAISASGIGISGTSAATASGGVGDGVRGESTGMNGNGVHGIANSGAIAFAVYGESSSGYAGYFSGKVNVSGVLTAGTKPFKIDHPLDPANKYLMHAAVESPDMKNIYDGIAVLDAGGEAIVELPEWHPYQIAATWVSQTNLSGRRTDSQGQAQTRDDSPETVFACPASLEAQHMPEGAWLAADVEAIASVRDGVVACLKEKVRAGCERAARVDRGRGLDNDWGLDNRLSPPEFNATATTGQMPCQVATSYVESHAGEDVRRS